MEMDNKTLFYILVAVLIVVNAVTFGLYLHHKALMTGLAVDNVADINQTDDNVSEIVDVADGCRRLSNGRIVCAMGSVNVGAGSVGELNFLANYSE